MSDDFDPVCLHKHGEIYETRVGWCCRICYAIRHRHSRLVLVPYATIGGITLSDTVAVPVAAGVSWMSPVEGEKP